MEKKINLIKWLCLRKIITFFLFVLIGGSYGQQPESIVSAPVKTFALDSDLLGAVSNSVNLYSGDVNLPLNIISLPGRNGLDVNVSILYNSNVHQQVDTWNLETPTGILGLGWSMDYERIIVDHKNTGSRYDDDFYLIAGGANNLLVRTGTDTDGSYIYELKTYQFWKIRFYSNDERWVIIKENGNKYEYGYQSSGRNTVQWGVKWDNWLGSSADTTGQQQFGLVWNLSKISNTWGDEISFKYLNIERQVGTGGQYHTEASYLQEITDVFGRKVVFNYGDKAAAGIEFKDPHVEAGEPDAYQERYETKFLDSLEVFSENSITLFSVDFAYDFTGVGNLIKRLLTSITQKNPDGESLPNLKFEYKTISPNNGALEKVTFPQGGTATYVYGTETIANSTRTIINTPTVPSDFDEPRVYSSYDYVVVTWYSDFWKQLQVWVYQWEGEWIETYFGHISNVHKVGGLQNFGIVVEKNFFAILDHSLDDDRYKNLYIYYKNPLKRGAWQTYQNQIDLTSNSNASITSGDRFVAVVSEKWGELNTYKWDGFAWNKDNFPDQTLGTFPSKAAIGGTNNYFVYHNPYSLTDSVKFYYLDEFNEWQTSKVPSNLSFESSTGYPPKWYAGNSFAVVFAEASDEYIYRWDEDFSTFYRDDLIGGMIDNSIVHLFESAISIAKPTVGSGVGKGLRWTGKEWKTKDFASSSTTNSSLGDDFIVRRNKATNGFVKRWLFNPNTLGWSLDDEVFNLYNANPVPVFYTKYAWLTGTGETPQAKIYNKTTNGWNESVVSSWSRFDDQLKIGNKFYIYDDFDGTALQGTRIGYFINGVWGNNASLDSYSVINGLGHVNNNTIVTGQTDIKNLYRYVDGDVIGTQTDYPVIRLEINDGYDTTYTSLIYNTNSARYDPSGSVAQYNEVKVVPGSNDPNSTPYGYTVNYFFNGLSNAELAPNAQFPVNETNVTNAEDYANLLKGLSYKSEVFDSQDNLVQSSTSYWEVKERVLGSPQKDVGYYSRQRKTIQTVDGVTSEVETDYNPNTGLASETRGYNYNEDGYQDTHITQYTYASEKYTTNFPANLLGPVVQTTTKVVDGQTSQTTTTGVSAATWKDWDNGNGKWAPHKSYLWKGSGSSGFNFTSWSGSGEPPASDWLKTSEIVSRTDEGLITQSKDVNDVYTSTLYSHPQLLPLAGFPNARISTGSIGDEASFLSFESNYEASGVEENDYWDLNSNNDFSTDAHTGTYSRELMFGTGPERDFLPSDQTRKYIFSAWAKAQIGFPSNNGEMVIHTKVDGPDDSVYPPNVSSAYVSMNITAVHPDWEYVELVLDLEQVRADGNIPANENLRIRCYFKNNDTGNRDFFVDDIRFSPVDAGFQATTYDEDYRTVTTTLGTNGEVVRPVYDRFQRNIAGVGPDDTVIGGSQTYFSRDGNNNVFNNTDPNSIITVTARNGGVFNDFNDGFAHGFTFNSGGWSVTNGVLYNFGVGQGDEATLNGFAGPHYGARVRVAHLSGPEDFGVRLGNAQVRRLNNSWELKDNDTVIATNSAPMAEDWLMIAHDNAVFFYADGRQIFSESISGISGDIKLFTGEQNTEVTFDDFLAFQDPLVSIDYLDGFGKLRQNQLLADSDAIFSETIYDDMSRAAVQTKVTLLTNTLSSFRPNFVSSFDWTTGSITGEVATNNPNDGGYPYARTIYDDSPLSRILESGLPGSDFRIGSGHTATKQYGQNAGNDWGLTLPAGEYFLQTTTDSDGDTSETISGKAGNVIAGRSGPINEPTHGSIYPMTTYKYDDFGNLVKTSPANLHTPPSGTTDSTQFATTMKYDFLGRLTKQTTPDADSTVFLYDKAGSLRFQMDAEGAAQSPNHVRYWKYDALSRTIEEGYIKQDWTTVQGNEEDPNWPATPTSTWRKQYEYDGDGLSPNKGRLVKLFTNNNDFGAREVEEQFTYDLNGNIITKRTLVDDYNKTLYTTDYEYDKLGNVTKISYLPADIVLNNQTIVGEVGYEASNTISTLNNVTIDFSSTDVTFTAGNSITLKDGFHVKESAKFTAELSNINAAATEVIYTYNHLGQVWQVGKPSNTAFYASYDYNANGSIAQEYFDTFNLTRTYKYNSPGWLTEISDPSFFKESIDYTANGYNSASYYSGQIAKTAFEYPWDISLNYQVQFQYDNLGWLQVADNDYDNSKDLGVGAGNEIKYDANGNFLTILEGTSAKNYGYYANTNKIKNTGGSANDYTYDAIGNVTASTPKNLSGLTYDSFTNMTSGLSEGGNSLSFGYSGANQRVLKDYDDQTDVTQTLYLHGNNSYPLLEKTKSLLESEESVIYIYGPTGLIATQTDELFFVIKDHLGSVRVVIDDTNTMRSYYDYAPFGNIFRSGVNEPINYQYTGQEHDSEIGLHNYRARFYDSDLGRFYGMDPAGQFASPYVYVDNSPIIYVDPDGELGFLAIIGIGALIGGTAGGVYAHLNDQPWWEGALIGAGAGAFLGSGLAIGGAYGTAVGASAFNSAQGFAFDGARGLDLLKYAGVGFATGYFSATGGLGLSGSQKTAKGFRIAGRLTTQALTTAGRSIGNRWANPNISNSEIFDSFSFGAGPINFRVGDGFPIKAGDNIFNIAFNGVGLLTTAQTFLDGRLSPGDIDFDVNSLSFNYKNELLEGFHKSFARATGAYTIFNALAGDLVEEGNHVWQSRFLRGLFLPTYFWSSLSPFLTGGDVYLDNFFERQAQKLF